MEDIKNNEKVIIIKNEQYNKGPSLWNLKNIGNGIKKSIIWISGVSILCGLGGVILTEAFINDSKEMATTNFKYMLPSYNQTELENGTIFYQFYDGSIFNTTDLLSEDVINKVAEEYFPNETINLKKLLNNGISLSADGYDDTSGKFIYYTPLSFNLSLKTSAFKSDDIAKQFIKKLVEYPLEQSVQALSHYSVCEEIGNSFDTFDFSRRVDWLNSTYAEIKTNYNLMSEDFADYYAADNDGKIFASYRTEFISSWYSNTSDLLVRLESELVSNNYLYFEEGKEEETAAMLKTKGENSIKMLKEYFEKIMLLEEKRTQLLEFQGIITDDSNYVEELIETTNAIYNIRDSIATSLKELSKMGYASTLTSEADTPLSLEDIDSASQVDSIYLPSTGNGYIQKLLDNSVEWKKECKNFANTCDEYKNKLNEQIATFNNVFRFMHSNYNAKVIYGVAGGAIIEGGTSWVVGLLLGLVLGFLVTSCIGCGLYICKVKSTGETKE